jgi:hypothetical protein
MDEGTFKWWRAMMADLYNFGLKYFVIPDGCDNDALTNSFVDAQIEFVKKHDRKDDHFAVGLMEKYGEGTVKVPCTGLMELVEKQDMAGAKLYLEKLFAGFDMDRADAVVLGCTHYVFLKDMIRAMIPAHVAITEGSDGTARQLRRVLEKNDLLRTEGPGEVVFETSGTDADLQTMKSFFQPLQATLVK